MKDVRILLVEDDPISGACMRAWLAHQGAQVVYAVDPAAAEPLMALQDFDVLLSDVCMPGNENLAWIEHVARRWPALHIVLFTGSPDLESAIKATNLHVAAFLVKPPNLPQLADVITRLQITNEARHRTKVCVDALRVALASPEPLDQTQVTPRLRELHAMLPAIESDPFMRAVAPNPGLREVVIDAVQVIERTKDNFHSRELGRLRQRLVRALSD